METITPGRIIYIINQTPALLKAWRVLSELQKRKVIEDCETDEVLEIERIIEEIVDGQRRLF